MNNVSQNSDQVGPTHVDPSYSPLIDADFQTLVEKNSITGRFFLFLLSLLNDGSPLAMKQI